MSNVRQPWRNAGPRMHWFQANTWYRSENPWAVCMFWVPCLSCLQPIVGWIISILYGHLPAGIFFPVHKPNDFTTLVGPNKGETAVCGCHCLRDMAVPMREILARPWVGVCVSLALSLHCLHYFQCNRIKFNLFFINYCFMTFLNKFNSSRV